MKVLRERQKNKRIKKEKKKIYDEMLREISIKI